jgi:hypothetical protein
LEASEAYGANYELYVKGATSMKSDTNTSQPRAGKEALEKAIQHDRASGCAMLCAFLDAVILFQEEAVSFEELTPLWNLYCRECGLEEEAEHLGLLPSSEAGVCSLAGREEIARGLAFHLAGQRLHLPTGDLTLGELLDGFTAHCRQELGIETDDQTKTWAGRCFSVSGRCHHVLIRPRPVLLRPHADSFFLLLCQLPAAGIETIFELFIESPGLRQRLAMVDLEKGFKINLTRSEIFVHFERYLHRMHGLRLMIHPDLTQSLVNGGIIKLEKG